MDGYEPTTKTVFQYYGCHWHGCPAHCKQSDARHRLRKTQQQAQKIKATGYTQVVAWECNKPPLEKNNTRATDCDLSTCYCVLLRSLSGLNRMLQTNSCPDIRKQTRANIRSFQLATIWTVNLHMHAYSGTYICKKTTVGTRGLPNRACRESDC